MENLLRYVLLKVMFVKNYHQSYIKIKLTKLVYNKKCLEKKRNSKTEIFSIILKYKHFPQ